MVPLSSVTASSEADSLMLECATRNKDEPENNIRTTRRKSYVNTSETSGKQKPDDFSVIISGVEALAIETKNQEGDELREFESKEMQTRKLKRNHSDIADELEAMRINDSYDNPSEDGGADRSPDAEVEMPSKKKRKRTRNKKGNETTKDQNAP